MSIFKRPLLSNPESKLGQIVFRLLAPLLFGVYPAYYYYTKNAGLIKIASLGRVIGVYFLLILLLYGIFLLVHRFKTVRAANSTTLLLLFFNTYGSMYGFLLDADFFRVEHLTLLPLYIFLALYSIWLIARIKIAHAQTIWRGTFLVFLALLLFTTLKLIPLEVEKASMQKESTRSSSAAPSSPSAQEFPDIYYLIFDEFAGFRSMREYWNNTEVDEFKLFLEEKGFFVSEDVRSTSLLTLHQMASRLNYTDYRYEWDDQALWQINLADNRAMALLESKGYTTIVFEELSVFYPNMPEISADLLYSSSLDDGVDVGVLFDDYGMLVADSTILRAYSKYYKSNYSVHNQHRTFVLAVKSRLPKLEDVPAPRFVYSHLMLPHPDFLFDRNGLLVGAEFTQDWSYYEGQYIFTMNYIEELVTAILDNADPQRQPVIILQSDHGARIKPDNEELPGFPQELRSDILFAMYLPGYDASTIPLDINPTNTLPLVFNHYLGESIPMQ